MFERALSKTFPMGLGDGQLYTWTDGLKRKDWHDYESIQKDAMRSGKGEQGKPYPLTEEDNDDSAYRENGFNIFVSNNIALERSLPDIRHPNCKHKVYLEKLPNTSIIIPFHNEGWTSLLRTIHSIINRTPSSLIAEIILVDDFSDRDSYFDQYTIDVTHVSRWLASGLGKDNWSVKGNAIEQTKTFQYLGITFSYNAKFSTHLTTSAISAERSANAILRLFRRKGAGFLPMALTVFQAKSLAQLLYGSQISPSANLKTLETVQSKFLRSLFATPKCTPNAVLRQEAGLPRVELKVWEQAISLWLKIHYNPKGLLPCFLAAVPYPPWLMQITNKIKQIGLNPENIFIGTLNKAKATITRRLYDIELQQEGALLPETYRCLKAWPNFAAALT
ncbi:Hypothetical predicted protein [Podarcis lilfordi]|uniref:Glycosyltransferase 2-like domain-containing protein n=1 Tax=Podarcis lilfordi TaxID=74358 RepID=A0AA35PCN8_9SAUR|nr:Hypothetical predicted protein [Podarcis lilfordi]